MPESLITHSNAHEWFELHCGEGRVVASAIHNGHGARPEVTAAFAISEADRLREEDPFTEYMIRDFANRAVVHRSRFETDINRHTQEAVYVRPEQSWGMKVWREEPDQELVDRSLAQHRQFYQTFEFMLSSIERRHGRFVVLDIHSYNHRREGADGPPTDPERAPEVNIGTHSLPKDRWTHVLEAAMRTLREFDYRGRRLDVRENVAFQGKGELARFVHRRFPETGCALAIEFKKFFMDEWTGEPYRDDLDAIRALLNATARAVEQALGKGA